MSFAHFISNLKRSPEPFELYGGGSAKVSPQTLAARAMKIKERGKIEDFVLPISVPLSFIHTSHKAWLLEIVPSTNTVYRYIHAGLLDFKPLDLPRLTRLRRRKNASAKPKQTKKQLGVSIEYRPAIINDRARFGDWEIDLVLGKKIRGEAVVMTLVERQTRYAMACKLPDKKSETITQAVRKLTASHPMLSITADNGVEFSQLSQIEDIYIHFAHPYSF